MAVLTKSRTRYKMTLTQARAKNKPGRYSDGGGLYLRVLKNGGKSWTFRFKWKGRDREIGLGAFRDVGLAEARELAESYRSEVRAGVDPVKPREVIIEKTFLDCLNIFLATKEAGWKNAKHIAQWRTTLMTYAKPLHRIGVGDITTPDVLQILQPIWLTKHETASRIRGRIEAVLDYAKAMGWRSGENPAVWRGNLKMLLPLYSRAQNIKHFAALDVKDIPEFMKSLRGRKAVVARLLEFIILTAARSGEARFMTWAEIDLDARTWVIPANRMKMGKEHIVPLSSRAVAVLTKLKSDGSRSGEFVFAHPINKKEFSINATRSLLKRMEFEMVTTHGFRSTFRDWAGDCTYYQRETIEAALSHGIKDKAEAAYRRSTALKKRQSLMQEWAGFCMGALTRSETTFNYQTQNKNDKY